MTTRFSIMQKMVMPVIWVSLCFAVVLCVLVFGLSQRAYVQQRQQQLNWADIAIQAGRPDADILASPDIRGVLHFSADHRVESASGSFAGVVDLSELPQSVRHLVDKHQIPATIYTNYFLLNGQQADHYVLLAARPFIASSLFYQGMIYSAVIVALVVVIGLILWFQFWHRLARPVAELFDYLKWYQRNNGQHDVSLPQSMDMLGESYVSLLKDLQHQQEQYQLLLESSQDVVLILDSNGNIQQANTIAENLLGLCVSVPGQQNIVDLFPESLRIRQTNLYEELINTRQNQHYGLSGNFVLCHENSSLLDVSMTIACLDNTGSDHYICLIRDISDYRDHQRLQQQMTDFQERLQKARELQTARESYVVAASQQVKASLTALLGVARQSYAHAANDFQRQYLESVVFAAEGAIDMAERLFERPALQAGQMLPANKPFSLHQIYSRLLLLGASMTQQRSLKLLVDLPPDLPDLLIGDVILYRQVLRTLFSNALKFTRQGHIRIRVSYRRSGGDIRLLTEVSDTGIGIAAGLIPQLFSRSANTTLADKESASLFLAYTQCTQSHGSMGVESQLSVGSRFWFELPFVAAPVHSAPAWEDIPIPLVWWIDKRIHQHNEMLLECLSDCGIAVAVRDFTDPALMHEPPADVLLAPSWEDEIFVAHLKSRKPSAVYIAFADLLAGEYSGTSKQTDAVGTYPITALDVFKLVKISLHDRWYLRKPEGGSLVKKPRSAVQLDNQVQQTEDPEPNSVLQNVALTAWDESSSGN
ncbi:PAS domain-containing sensor histidine kinase [Gynuella sunshinyii]|uniref:histidine kinase n=1 Tax=Gynuella sunshinyii YC6258 TaxID=1445510 RepID=A0A0C5VCS3_9GAMM|nr:ATP-binding protein [Gynuella sunshinyii]AJQ92272.1 signal transduction histidine kinase [Gynuella sunshinyii YC6258]